MQWGKKRRVHERYCAFDHSATSAVASQRRDSNPRYLSEQHKRSITRLRHPLHFLVSSWGYRRPASRYGPTVTHYARPCGSTSGVEPATIPGEGEERPGYGTQLETWFLIYSENSGQQAAGVSTIAEATEGDSNPISLINSQISTNEVTPAYGTRIRRIRPSLGRATGAAPSRSATTPVGSRLPHVGRFSSV